VCIEKGEIRIPAGPAEALYHAEPTKVGCLKCLSGVHSVNSDLIALIILGITILVVSEARMK
jgi:hypothetical protein